MVWIIGDNRILSNLFNCKLTSAGYFAHHKPHYKNVTYLIREEEFYNVTGDFPRIEEKNLMKGVGDVKYSIVITSETEKYKTKFLR